MFTGAYKNNKPELDKSEIQKEIPTILKKEFTKMQKDISLGENYTLEDLIKEYDAQKPKAEENTPLP